MVLRGRWALGNTEGVSSSAVHWFSFVIHSKPSLSWHHPWLLAPLSIKEHDYLVIYQGTWRFVLARLPVFKKHQFDEPVVQKVKK